MIATAKISAERASGVRRLLAFLSQMRRLIEGGAYSSKYGNACLFLSVKCLSRNAMSPKWLQ